MQMVQESRRAWHAGQSFWAGETDINSCSIGIEIVNPGHDYDYPDFPKRQIAAVTALCRGISNPKHHSADARAGAFGYCAVAQAGSGREISLAHALRFRDRPLGQARADHRGRSVLALGDRGEAVTALQESLQRIRLRRHRERDLQLRHARRRWPPSSVISGRSASMASAINRPTRRCATCWLIADGCANIAAARPRL